MNDCMGRLERPSIGVSGESGRLSTITVLTTYFMVHQSRENREFMNCRLGVMHTTISIFQPVAAPQISLSLSKSTGGLVEISAIMCIYFRLRRSSQPTNVDDSLRVPSTLHPFRDFESFGSPCQCDNLGWDHTLVRRNGPIQLLTNVSKSLSLLSHVLLHE